MAASVSLSATSPEPEIVAVNANAINNNNLAAASPFTLLTEDGSAPFLIQEKKFTGPHCVKCAREFKTYTEQELHKAKPCSLAVNNAPDAPKVRIVFDREHLPYVASFLESKSITVHDAASYSAAKAAASADAAAVASAASAESKDNVFIVVPVDGLKHFLAQLYFAQIALYNIEVWYHALQRCKDAPTDPDLTAPTTFVALSDAELKLLQKVYSHRALGGQLSVVILCSDVNSGDGLSSLGKADRSALTALERRIAAQLKPDQAYFCRLSTRSPKDGGAKLSAEAKAAAGPAERLRTKNSQLRVTSAEMVTTLLTRSARVFADITNYFEYRTLGSTTQTAASAVASAGAAAASAGAAAASAGPAAFVRKSDTLPDASALNLILREWLPDLPHDREFRCYVHKGRLTAISQYHCYDVFESLHDKRLLEQIRDAIIQFHGRVRAAFGVPSYVFDVVVHSDFRVQVIELNPFGAHMSSGSGLFNWQTDRDVLYGVGAAAVFEQPVMRVLQRLIDDHGQERSV